MWYRKFTPSPYFFASFHSLGRTPAIFNLFNPAICISGIRNFRPKECAAVKSWSLLPDSLSNSSPVLISHRPGQKKLTQPHQHGYQPWFFLDFPKWNWVCGYLLDPFWPTNAATVYLFLAGLLRNTHTIYCQYQKGYPFTNVHLKSHCLLPIVSMWTLHALPVVFSVNDSLVKTSAV
jgi:hypothetical protein